MKMNIDMKKDTRWTLNADVGEGCDDALIMPYLDCANIACGAHAGNEAIMRETVKLAKKHNVSIGAHPGYPDKANFGRHSLAMSQEALTETLTDQITLLLECAKDQDITPVYVKPHGALNHDMLKKTDIFTLICQVVSTIDKTLVIMVPTNANDSQQQDIAQQHGLTIWWEVFADRAYEPNGLLRSRQYDDAVHEQPQHIINQLNRIQKSAEIVAVDGSVLDVSQAQTICLHGDHAPSIDAVQKWAKQL